MDLSGNPLWSNVLVFAVASVFVWQAGTRVAEFADELAQRYHLSRAFLGLFMLSTISSLPEIATSFTAAAHANAALAINNLLGSILLQITLLALADLLTGKRALTAVVPDALVLLQGSLNIVLLALVVIAITLGDVQVFHVGIWSLALIAATGFAAFALLRAGRERKPWLVNPDDANSTEAKQEEKRTMSRKYRDDSGTLLFGKLALAMLTILTAGAALAYTGEALGMQTGLGQSFAGVALVSTATSLPEVSTVFASVRAGLYTMAISDILGTNILNVALVGGVDLIDTSGAALDTAGDFSALAAMLGILVTGIFMAGLSERANRTYLHMGLDSILVLCVYVAGMFMLYRIRDGG